MSEVIAFPTQLSYSRLLNHAKSAYHAYHNLGKFVELGENVNIRNNVNASANVSTNADADANANALDLQSRSKLNAAGTNLWNTIQKHPGLFMDVISNLNSRDYSHGHDNRLLNDNGNEHGNERGDERGNERGNEHGNQSKSSSKTVPIPPHVIANQKLERVRGAASGYIRALVCRMILISKFKTSALDIAELVEVDGVHVSASSTSASALVSASASASVTLPCALSSELEFGLKCFSRAGRAILVHSEDYESAFRVLSLAIVCWRGLEKTHTHTSEHGHGHDHDHDHDHQYLRSGAGAGAGTGAGAGGLVGGHARNEAFDALLLLPDCASKFVTSTAHDSHGKRGGERERDAEAVDADGGNSYDEKNNDDDEDYSPSSKRIIAQLQQLEDFVHDQRVSTTKPLFATQHYLPSLARIGYKVS